MALLFSLLAPAAHHIVNRASAGDPQITEICTGSGVKLLQAGQPDLPKSPLDQTPDTSKHCGYCFSVASTFPLAPSRQLVFLAADIQPPPFPAQYIRPATPFPWTVLPSRGPPLA